MNHWVSLCSALQQGQPRGVLRDDLWGQSVVPPIHSVWIAAFSHAKREIDLRSLCKSFNRAREGPATFLRMPGKLWVWLFLCIVLSLPFQRVTGEQTERFGKAGETDCHQDKRVSGLRLFSCPVLLGDPSLSSHCQQCELQQFGRARKWGATNCWLIAKAGDDSVNRPSKDFCQWGEESDLNPEKPDMGQGERVQGNCRTQRICFQH